MRCTHQPKKKDWLTSQNGVIKLHPYCCNCGTVKNVSSDKGKKIGYFINSLARLRKTLEQKGYRVSEAQIRMIIKELCEIDGFEDTYWITFSRQKEIFITLVRKYIKISQDIIEYSL
jgi:hypothetical protein